MLLFEFYVLNTKTVAMVGDKTLRINCLKKAWNILPQVENAGFDYAHETIFAAWSS